ncbi:hypothetical protein KJ682_11815 [bacterium]|nr:hypothetical protein [bacterium]
MNVTFRLVLLSAAVLLLAVPALAQTNEEFPEEGSADPVADEVLAPLILPADEDFAEPAGEPAPAGIGVASYVEVSDTQKAGLLTPFYRFNPNFAVKVRVPLIFDRTFHYWGVDASGSGLGDVSVDLEYSRLLSPGMVFRLQGSVKLPTGDDEKVEEIEGFEYATPLGTGSTDFFGRAQIAKSGPSFGWLGSVLYRTNGSTEVMNDYGSFVETVTADNGDAIVTSGFARMNAGGKVWIHLGASAAFLGDGTVESTYNDGTPSFTSDILTKGTLVDLYPGISYKMGKWNPFLGVRVPVVTDYDNEFADDSRDAAFIFQFSYNPARMTE